VDSFEIFCGGAEQAPAAPGGEQQRDRQRRLLERRPSQSGDRSGEQNSRDDSHLGPQWLRQAAASAKEPEQQRCERGVGGEARPEFPPRPAPSRNDL
jgi:hypothetical protein